MCQVQAAEKPGARKLTPPDVAGRPATKGVAGQPRAKAPLPPWKPVPPVRGADPVLSAQAAILLDAQTGQVLWEHNSTARMYPASLTKMMTGLLAVETRRLEQVHYASETAAKTGESSIALQKGEALKLQQVLRASLIKSANDATVMVAESVAGSVPAFVQMMNDRAQAMGLTGTHFTNPHGLHDPDHYSTAADLAQIARQGMLNPTFARIVGTREAVIPWPGKPWMRKLVNRNRLLLRWDECNGVKTGYTKHAGRCLAASATMDGWRLICVVLKCRDSWSDAETLLRWGPLNYQRQRVAWTGDTFRVPVRRGARRSVEARPQTDLYVVGRYDQTISTAVREDGTCEAPVEPGQVVGRLTTRTGASVPLVAAEQVPLSLWARLSDVRAPQAGAGLVVLLAAGVLLHGAGAKTARTRRRRLAAREREADRPGPGDDRRADGAPGE